MEGKEAESVPTDVVLSQGALELMNFEIAQAQVALGFVQLTDDMIQTSDSFLGIRKKALACLGRFFDQVAEA